MSKEFVSQWDISTMSSKCAVSIWSRLFLYKWWEQMAEIEINDFFSLLGNTMYIIKRLTVPTSGYRGLAHLPECSGHIKNPGHIKRGWCILWQYGLWSFQTGGTILYFCIRINILRGNYWILRIGLMGALEVFKNQRFFWTLEYLFTLKGEGIAKNWKSLAHLIFRFFLPTIEFSHCIEQRRTLEVE